MADKVKTRPYNSPLRQEQAAATRDAILDAAERLFRERGYAATPIVAIAREAGVALKTVYLAFDTKAGVLRALWNRALRGDGGDVPVAQQEWYREALEEPDPVKQLELNARNSRAAKLRIADVLLMIRQGAPTDADIAELWDRIQSDFHANQRAIVERMAKRGALRKGLGVDEATDVLWTLNHPDVWHLLVRERGWTPEQYEEWFFASARAALLDGRPRRSR
jgi:AcrR family transcriptional regulator